MPRVLTASRATVREGQEPAYLAAVGQLARRLRGRGESFWLFRHPTARDRFLEFSESADPERHRLQQGKAGDAEEAALEARLRSLAEYAPDASVLWEEVPVEAP